jgi:hypothetical protein
MPADVIDALRGLEEACRHALDSGDDLVELYAALRVEAVGLNDRHHWATAEEFAAQAPTLEALNAIESLDRAFSESSFDDLPGERGAEVRLADALIQLAGWATGVRLAYETLRDMDSR